MYKKVILTSMIAVPLTAGVVNAQSSEGIVTTAALNVRTGASTSYKVKFLVYRGDKVEITGSSNGWYNIKTKDGKIGWASSKYIEVQNKTTTKQVSVSTLNMRTGPSTSYKIITTLKRNQEVEIISEQNGWAKIIYNSKTGYVSSQYLKDKVESNIQIKYVNTGELNVRSGPSTNYKILAVYKYGQKVEIVNIDGTWAKIKYNNSYAYVSDKYLSVQLQPDKENENTNNTDKGGITNTYENLSYSLSNMVDYEYALSQQGYNKISGKKATRDELHTYLNPDTFKTNSTGKLQFLKINKYRQGITASELNTYFSKYCKSNSVFINKGQAFIDAAKKYNLDVTYLVAASMVETGYGSSTLAQGVYVNTPSGQKVKVYNFFGISAYDGTAVLSASNYAYKKGWTTIDKTIEGSAEWIANNYIHSSKYNQNTLYKMRWSYKTGHQYATDINWANTIGRVMNNILPYYNESTNLEYLIPKYK